MGVLLRHILSGSREHALKLSIRDSTSHICGIRVYSCPLKDKAHTAKNFLVTSLIYSVVEDALGGLEFRRGMLNCYFPDRLDRLLMEKQLLTTSSHPSARCTASAITEVLQPSGVQTRESCQVRNDPLIVVISVRRR